MSDEIKDQETTAESGHVEWSGTPFQGRGGSGNGESETQEEGENKGMEFEETGKGTVEETAGGNVPSEEPASAPREGQPVDYSHTFRALQEGDVVNGVVVHIDREGVLVDVGTKSEGLVRPHELSRESNLNPEDVVTVGDRIDVYVMQSEDQEGGLILSKKRADFERAWERVEEALRTDKVLTAMVSDRVKGGLVVDLGIRGFVPASHVGSGKVKNLEKYVGQSLPLRVIEVDRERRKVVLSHRKAVEEEREKQRTETLKTLAEGQLRSGVVRRITDYGAFVDLGGIDGLLHISEMSWTRIKHPSDVVKVGDKIQVMVLKLNLDQEKVSLGLRQILPDPWSEVEKKYSVGDVIKGSVSRLVPFGAFVQLEGGIEGIIPNSELATRRISKPEDVVSVGEEVEVKVVDLRPEERRMTLSIRQLQQVKEREQQRTEVNTYNSYVAREEPKTTIGDLVGDMVREAAKFERRERKRKEHEAVEAAAEMETEEIEEPMFPEPEVQAEAVVVAEETVEAPVVEETEAVEEVAAVEEPVAEETPVVEETATEEVKPVDETEQA